MGLLFEKSADDGAAGAEGTEKPTGTEAAEGAAAEKPAAAAKEEGEGGEPEKPKSLFEKPAKAKDSVDDRNFLKHPRWNELIGQRNEARERASAAEQKLGSLTPYQEKVTALYGKYEDPLGMLETDVAILEAWEQLAKTDPEVARAGEKILAVVRKGGGKVAQGAEKPNGREAQAAAPNGAAATKATDPLVARLLERDARATIMETLKPHGIKDAFQRTIANDLLRSLSEKGTEALAALTPEEVEEHTRTWIAEHGFNEEELTGKRIQRATPRRTPSSNGAAADAGGGDPGEPANGRPKGEKAPQNFREWQAAHSQRYSAARRAIGQS